MDMVLLCLGFVVKYLKWIINTIINVLIIKTVNNPTWVCGIHYESVNLYICLKFPLYVFFNK